MKMKITIALDDKLVNDLRKIAGERGTTIGGLVCDYLEGLTSAYKSPESKQRELEALERSFKTFQFKMDRRTWKREDLYTRH